MRESLSAFGFLAMLTIAPFFVTAGILWSILNITDSGLLIGSGEVTTVTTDQDVEMNVVRCSYFTAAGFMEKVVDQKEYGYRGQHNCPWRVDIST